MSVNTLETRFVFDDKDGIKIDSIHKKLNDANNGINNLGKNSLFGKNIADSIKPAETALDSLNKKFADSTQKPTISRYWETEENKTVASLKNIENAYSRTTDLLNKPLKNVGADSLKRISSANSFIERSENPLTDAQPRIDLDKLQKKAEDTRKSLADISAQKISAGNIGNLTKEIVSAHERSKQLVVDIKNIKTELSNPNRKSSIKFLTDELQAAEREADRLNRKLSSLPNSQSPSRSRAGGNNRRGGITNAQATFLEFADDFAPEGLNRAFNAAGRAVFAAQNIKDAAKEMSLLSGLSLTTLATFGAIAATGFVIVDASSKIREQSEKRLLNEQLISGAINKQIIGLRDAFSEYEKFKRSLGETEAFTNRITSAVNTYDAGAVKRERERIDSDNKSRITEINRLQAELAQNERSLEFAKSRNVNQNLFTELGIGREYAAGQKQQDVAQAERAVEKSRKALAESETALEKGKSAFQQTNQALTKITEKQNDAFNQRWENWKKAQESAAESQRKSQQAAIEMEKKFQAEVEKGKNKVIELGKIQKSALDELYQKKNADNPFVQIFSDADNSLKTLRENLKGLPEDMRKAAIETQQAINKNKLFETRIDNNLSVLDLKETADKFRNPNRAEADNKRFQDIVQDSILANNSFAKINQTSYGQYITDNLIRDKKGNSEITPQQERDIYNVAQLKNLSGNPKFESLLGGNVNDRSLISRLARERIANPNENLSINERLQKQFSIINSNVTDEDEKAIADKRFLAISSNLDPAQISSGLREQIASAADREAKRKGEFERKNYELEKEKITTQQKLIEALNNLTKIAEKKGIEGVNKAVEIIVKDETKFGVSTGSAGTMADTMANYFEDIFE